jgi:hypothetical protein
MTDIDFDDGCAEVARLQAEIERLRLELAQAKLFEDAAANLEAEILRLRAALRPFANIKPSTLYPDDGSEEETYGVILDCKSIKPDFTGADLARARAALAPGGVK